MKLFEQLKNLVWVVNFQQWHHKFQKSDMQSYKIPLNASNVTIQTENFQCFITISRNYCFFKKLKSSLNIEKVFGCHVHYVASSDIRACKRNWTWKWKIFWMQYTFVFTLVNSYWFFAALSFYQLLQNCISDFVNQSLTVPSFNTQWNLFLKGA